MKFDLSKCEKCGEVSYKQDLLYNELQGGVICWDCERKLYREQLSNILGTNDLDSLIEFIEEYILYSNSNYESVINLVSKVLEIKSKQ